MKKRIIFALLIVLTLALGTGLWYVLDTEESLVRGEVAATIYYTESGYEPKEVRIRTGQAVRWVNNSPGEMWPAAAVHPTHAIYPQKSDTDCLGSSFDSCRRLQPGETYEFTFTYEGDWKFHDHVRPSKTGVVKVEK